MKILLISIISLIAVARSLPTDSNTLDLLILHNNDMHARFDQTGPRSDQCNPKDFREGKCYGGFARVGYLVKKYRQEAEEGGIPVLYLNAGDTYAGTSWYNLFKENITTDFLNVLKPDAISLGNHEFDDGVEGLLPFLNNANFPVLATNLDMSKAPELAQAKSLKNSHVFNIKGHKIGVIGYLTPETKILTPANNVDYFDEVPSINTEAEKLKKDGVNIIIALGHSGFLEDKKIAAECPDVDLVIGGHSNTFLYNGPKPDLEDIVGPYPVVVQQNGKQVPVLQAYAFTKYLGSIKLKFNKDGNLISWIGQPILLNGSIPQDQEILELLEKYRPQVTALQEEIIGKTKVILDGNCRFRECNLGNLITDSMIYEYAYQYNGTIGWTDAPIAFLQGGGIRASIDSKHSEGNISKLDIYSVLPFDNFLLTKDITGKQIKEALEWSVRRYSNDIGNGEFLQMSGIHVEYNLTKPSGQRVMSVEVLCGLCEIPKYSKLKEDNNYKMVLTEFLVNGGDGFNMLKGTNYTVIKGKDVDVLGNYINRLEVVYPPIEQRIIINGELQKDGANTIILSLSVIIVSVLYHFIVKVN